MRLLLTCPSSFLRPWGNFWLALSVTAAPCQLSRRESQVGSPPEACRKPSLASPFGGGGLALARTERAARQRPPTAHGRRTHSPKQSLFALTYRPAVPYNQTTSWGSSLLGLPSGNVNTLASAWYCLKKRDSWKTSIWHGVFSASLFSCAGHPEFWR